MDCMILHAAFAQEVYFKSVSLSRRSCNLTQPQELRFEVLCGELFHNLEEQLGLANRSLSSLWIAFGLSKQHARMAVFDPWDQWHKPL